MGLKANELRLNNWVYAFKTTYQIDINDFDQDKVNTYKPIPITEEWLLKFQCDKFSIKDRFEVDIQGEIFEFFVNDIENSFHIEFTGGEGVSFSKPIKYLHQLQNLYFALTNKELEIKM